MLNAYRSWLRVSEPGGSVQTAQIVVMVLAAAALVPVLLLLPASLSMLLTAAVLLGACAVALALGQSGARTSISVRAVRARPRSVSRIPND